MYRAFGAPMAAEHDDARERACSRGPGIGGHGCVLPDHLVDNVHPAHRQLIRSRCQPWQGAPQPIGMQEQQEKAFVTAGRQEGPGVSCSPNCGHLTLTPAAGRFERRARG